mgnify:CR=1 FL=1
MPLPLPLVSSFCRKIKGTAVALSAHYFEARCLEATWPKEEAANIYAEVAEAGNRILSARTHELRQHPFCQREEEKSMR